MTIFPLLFLFTFTTACTTVQAVMFVLCWSTTVYFGHQCSNKILGSEAVHKTVAWLTRSVIYRTPQIAKLTITRGSKLALWPNFVLYRIVFGLVSVNKDDFFQLYNASTTGHPYKLYKPFSHCRTRTSFFSIRVVVWNDLPANIVDFRSLQSFKKTVSTVDLSKYLSDTYS